MNLIYKKHKSIATYFRFKCVKCGECCKSGYKVEIRKEDIELWKKSNNIKVLNQIKLDIECISMQNAINLIERDIISPKENKILNPNHFYNRRLKKILYFIKKSHFYRGIASYYKKAFSFLPGFEMNPIFNPKYYNYILKGMKLGLDYIISINSKGICPFLSLNSCSIQNYKPIACKLFPFDCNGNLREDQHFLTVCKGLKTIKFNLHLKFYS